MNTLQAWAGPWLDRGFVIESAPSHLGWRDLHLLNPLSGST